MRSSLFLAALLIFCLQLSAVKGDACNFTVIFQYNTQNIVTVAPYAAVQSCFAAVPFSATFRDQTLDVLNQLFTMYSFTDIVADSGAPWNLQVNVWSELNRINSTVYPNDYAMVVDIRPCSTNFMTRIRSMPLHRRMVDGTSFGHLTLPRT